jgi:hypothetical protein
MTNVQRAICCVADGEPLGDLWDDELVRVAFGRSRPPEVAPRELLVLAGIRCGKSMIAAAKSARGALTCDVSALSAGDQPLVPMLATERKTAQQLYAHTMALFRQKALIGRLVEETADGLWVRHDSGVQIEISVAALSRAGSTLVSRWLAGCTFDEAPRMIGADEGVRNLNDAKDAIEGRVLPGGQVLEIGSPWAPFGPVYDMVRTRFGKPAEDLVVVRAPGPVLNPAYWTPERVEWFRIHKPVAYRINVLGEFTDPPEAMIPSEAIIKAIPYGVTMRQREKGIEYVATMDPATRGNAWTLTVLGCTGLNEAGHPRLELARAAQWQGRPDAPLKPREVLEEVKNICAEYGVDSVISDQASIDAYADIGDLVGIGVSGIFVGAEERWEMVELVRLALIEERLSLLDEQPQLRSDLLRVEKRATTKGYTVRYPSTGDGRHCDFVPALGLALLYPPAAPSVLQKREERSRYADPEKPQRPRQYETGSLVRQLIG